MTPQEPVTAPGWIYVAPEGIEAATAALKAAGLAFLITAEPDYADREYAVEYTRAADRDIPRYNRVQDEVAARNVEANYRFAGAEALDPNARAVVRTAPGPWKPLKEQS